MKLCWKTISLYCNIYLINWINDRKSNLKSKNTILNISSHRPRENSNCFFMFLTCGYPCDYISEIWNIINMVFISAVQVLSHIRLFAASWTAACQASLSITNCQSSLKLMSIESVMISTISSFGVPFSSHLQSFPASGSFQMSQFFASGGQILKL